MFYRFSLQISISLQVKYYCNSHSKISIFMFQLKINTQSTNSRRYDTEIRLFRIHVGATLKFDYFKSMPTPHWNPIISNPCRRDIEIRLFQNSRRPLKSDYFKFTPTTENPTILNSRRPLKFAYFEFTPTTEIRLFRIYADHWNPTISEFKPITKIRQFWIHADESLKSGYFEFTPPPPHKALYITISGRNLLWVPTKNSTRYKKGVNTDWGFLSFFSGQKPSPNQKILSRKI